MAKFRKVRAGLSVLAAAREAGVDEKLLRKLIAAGRITRRGDGTIDREQFEREWAAYEAEKRPKIDRPSTTRRGRGRGAADAPGDELGDEPVDVRRMSYQAARQHRERFAALAAELEYESKAGRLIDRETVRQQWFEASRRARNLLETMADRLAPVVVGITDLHEARQAIASEVRRVCEEIAGEPPGSS